MIDLTEKSREMMVRSFEQVRYRYDRLPDIRPALPYGIYVHVPFCKKTCSFCPFYKNLYRADRVAAYLDALEAEIGQAFFPGPPSWIYFGGGTPNVLSLEQLKRITAALGNWVPLNHMGIELHPGQADGAYIRGLRELGFEKISLGVESLSPDVAGRVHRDQPGEDQLAHLLEAADEQKFFVNLDLMTGLPGQDEKVFLHDVERAASFRPSQLTLYPYMVIRGRKDDSSLPEEAQFSLIERAWLHLESNGYSRKGPWTFGLGEGLYDSSRDELVDDYLGFGPGAFSTYGGWKIVNPVLELYLKNMQEGCRKALLAPKTPSTDAWRLFGRMIADLELKPSAKFNPWINAYIRLLILAGYGRKGRLTGKGIGFAHALTKTIVESLPFPLQDDSRIENAWEYREAREAAKTAYDQGLSAIA